jgi:tellurite resistance-related uncharacterized protein
MTHEDAIIFQKYNTQTGSWVKYSILNKGNFINDQI